MTASHKAKGKPEGIDMITDTLMHLLTCPLADFACGKLAGRRSKEKWCTPSVLVLHCTLPCFLPYLTAVTYLSAGKDRRKKGNFWCWLPVSFQETQYRSTGEAHRKMEVTPTPTNFFFFACLWSFFFLFWERIYSFPNEAFIQWVRITEAFIQWVMSYLVLSSLAI